MKFNLRKKMSKAENSLPIVSYHTRSAEETLKELQCNASGLSKEEAEKRLSLYGANELVTQKKKNAFIIFLEQFKDLLVLILIAAAIISIVSGSVESSIVIFAVLILNAILGTVQTLKAEKSLEGLKALSSPVARVLRDGVLSLVPSKEVTAGDIVQLEAGDLVVADGRIIENYSLKVNESSLTGESEAVEKTTERIAAEDAALGDRKNSLYAGSLVTYGRARYVVTGVGMNTQLGKIASLMQSAKEKKTPLQRSLDKFSLWLAIAVLAVCVLVFGLSMWQQMPVLEALMYAVALAVAAIPEALGSIVTIVLAIGTQKMAKENAIIKNLNSVESLGSVSIICSDKTGTLTQNKMTVRAVYLNDKFADVQKEAAQSKTAERMLLAAGLCSDAEINDSKELGDPTEVALVKLCNACGKSAAELRADYPRESEAAFDSDRKLMSVLVREGGGGVMYTKGATDVILDRCESILEDGGVRKLTPKDKESILNANSKFSQEGLRVLSFGYKSCNKKVIGTDDEHSLVFIGLLAMIDPPREESKQAVHDAVTAGIKPIMITGDHKITASAIAKELGILNEGETALEGKELDKLTDAELDEILPNISVYARVSPENKIRIVDAWQRRGNIVAMTGDGVNDAPALKKADIGVAMGITGTEVSKDAASMILADDNFATIVKAVSGGRSMYSNIKNAIRFLLSGNLSGILCVLYASFASLAAPFLPVHLLFINLVTDSMPAIAIGMEKPSGDLLREKPRNPKEPIMTKDFILSVIATGFLIGAATMGSYYIGLASSVAAACTMAFVTLTLARLFHGFNCRSKRSLFTMGLFSNLYSLGALIAGIVLVNAVMFIPGLNTLFAVAPLSAAQIGYIYLLAVAPTVVIQCVKGICDFISAKKDKKGSLRVSNL